MADRFDQLLIFIPDSIYEISLQVSKGCSPSEAAALSRDMAAHFLSTHEDQLTSISTRLSIVRSSQIETTSEYQVYHDQLKSLFGNDAAFHRAILDFVKVYLMRQCGDTNQGEDRILTNKAELSCSFILAELAAVACIIERGYAVSIYPGSIDLFHDISSGLHPAIPEPLKKLINVGISFRRLASAKGDPSNQPEMITTG